MEAWDSLIRVNRQFRCLSKWMFWEAIWHLFCLSSHFLHFMLNLFLNRSWISNVHQCDVQTLLRYVMFVLLTDDDVIASFDVNGADFCVEMNFVVFRGLLFHQIINFDALYSKPILQCDGYQLTRHTVISNPIARLFCGGKYRRNSVENDYWLLWRNPGLSPFATNTNANTNPNT